MDDRDCLLFGRVGGRLAELEPSWSIRLLPAGDGIAIVSPRFEGKFPLEAFRDDFDGALTLVMAQMARVDLQNIYNECQTDADRFDGWRWRRPGQALQTSAV